MCDFSSIIFVIPLQTILVPKAQFEPTLSHLQYTLTLPLYFRKFSLALEIQASPIGIFARSGGGEDHTVKRLVTLLQPAQSKKRIKMKGL